MLFHRKWLILLINDSTSHSSREHHRAFPIHHYMKDPDFFSRLTKCFWVKVKLEDLKVLRRSPDHLNNVKIVQGQLQLIME